MMMVMTIGIEYPMVNGNQKSRGINQQMPTITYLFPLPGFRTEFIFLHLPTSDIAGLSEFCFSPVYLIRNSISGDCIC
jgi:hypothetical protein